MVLMANRRKELGIKNFELNLTSTPWAKKKKINFSFLSIAVYLTLCHWFSIKFLKRYLISSFIASMSCVFQLILVKFFYYSVFLPFIIYRRKGGMDKKMGRFEILATAKRGVLW